MVLRLRTVSGTSFAAFCTVETMLGLQRTHAWRVEGWRVRYRRGDRARQVVERFPMAKTACDANSCEGRRSAGQTAAHAIHNESCGKCSASELSLGTKPLLMGLKPLGAGGTIW